MHLFSARSFTFLIYKFRPMSKDGLNRMEFEISELAKAVGFNVISKDRNPAWKPINDKFANDILEELKIYKPNARITAVHAGLECGVLLEKRQVLVHVLLDQISTHLTLQESTAK